MSDLAPLPPDLDAELDEVLSLLPLVGTLPALADRVFARLVDGLAQALLHDVRSRYEAGASDRATYLGELCELVVLLQNRGLLGTRPRPA